MYWYVKVLKQYAGFHGRASRKEYWMFTLFYIIFATAAMVLDKVFGLTVEKVGVGPLYGLYILSTLIPGLAVTVRRLHDTGKSGLMILVTLIPVIGSIWLLVLLVTKSNPGENQYGTFPEDMRSEKSTPDHSTGDTLVLLVVIWMFFSLLVFHVLPEFINYQHLRWLTFPVTQIFINLIWAFVPLGLTLAIKDKTKQIIVFILGCIYLLYVIFSLLMPNIFR
ncbi:MAG: DUF805 domain-containing protein [Chlorobi bacterium]|nr:DUF805 domain-containing protein [Chlorobiota bacterium]